MSMLSSRWRGAQTRKCTPPSGSASAPMGRRRRGAVANGAVSRSRVSGPISHRLVQHRLNARCLAFAHPMAKPRGWGGSDRYRFALFSAPYSSFERVSFSGCTIVLFGAGTQAARNGNVSNPVECQLIGRWPIVEADLWDRAYLDLAG